MPQAVIVGAVRTPIGKRAGSLKDWRPDDLAAFVLRALADRTGIEPKIVEDVVLGCVTQVDEQGLNIARLAPLIAGFPESVPGTSVNRMCASGLQAFNFAAMQVITGQTDSAIAGRVEVESSVTVRTAAGDSVGINDGACGILVTTPDKARELKLEPRVRFVSTGVAGTNPTIMLDGTIPAIRKALARADLKVDDIDIWEVNEAFASVPIATRETIGFDDAKLNVNGGAIALGHPLGMSGARLITTMLHEMERQDLHYGLASLCIGFGMGLATIIERLT